jgi:aminopeptidase N
MKKLSLLPLFLGFFFTAQAQFHEHNCADAKAQQLQRSWQNARLSAVPGADTYDIHFYHINLNVSNTSRTLGGNVRFDALVTQLPLDTFWFELRDFMQIDSVLINGVNRPIIRANHVVRIPLAEPLAVGQNVSCQVFYNGTPPSGGFFSGVSNNNGVTWTLSEPFSAPDWLPCKQDLSDKIDSSWFFATTNAGTKVGSNGLLTQVVTLPNNKVRYEWKTRYKMAFYLIAFAVADYEEYLNYAHPSQMNGDSILIQNYIYTGSLGQNKTGLDRTPDMVEFFSDRFILYPFHEEKYGHMQANLGGGMEHQTMSTMGGFGQDLTAHELGHQWFGDYVTCASWSDIWVNEGWASYTEYLYRQHLSQSSADSWLVSAHNTSRNATTGSVYVPAGASVNRIFNGTLSYKKAGSVLHMLRYVLGDSLFFAGANALLNQKANDVASTEDVKQIFEQVSQQSLTRFFDDWIYGEGFPSYQIEWNQRDSMLYVVVNQTTTSPTTPQFATPLPLRITVNGQQQFLRLDPTQVNVFQINGTMTGILLDPTNIILKGTSSISRNTSLGLSIANLPWPDVKIYPNPVQGELNLELDRNATFELIDAQGRKVFEGEAFIGKQQLILPDLAPGLYVLQLQDGKSRHLSRLVIH